MNILLKNAMLVSQGMVSRQNILVQNGCVAAISSDNSLNAEQEIPCEKLYVSHGFVDIHVHGGGGHDFMDGTTEAWQKAAELHLKHGTTAMVPTTLASHPEELKTALSVWHKCGGGFENGAKFLGMHIEGPYISPAQAGAQDPAFIRQANPDEYVALINENPQILRWTIAPECGGALEMGDYLASRGIVPSIGHSDATHEQVMEATLHGYSLVTHLYSATSTIVRKGGFRHAGIVESAYLLPQLNSEVIADGRHLPASLLQMAYRFIGPDRLCLVTDAMRAAGQQSGESILGSLKNGQKVILEDGVAKMPDKTAFAGSICTADRLVKNMVNLAGSPLAEAVKMITETPAKTLNMQHKTGFVFSGRAADLVLFDEDINIKLVMTDGNIRYQNM